MCVLVFVFIEMDFLEVVWGGCSGSCGSSSLWLCSILRNSGFSRFRLLGGSNIVYKIIKYILILVMSKCLLVIVI